MTATITHTLGRFVWRELFTRDVAAAKRFYGELFGWTWEDRPMGPDWSYTLWKNGEKQIGGMMDLANLPAADAHVPPHWAVYVSVADVDRAAEVAVAEGGRVLGACHDIPGVGRFAVVQDPQGAILNPFRSATGDPADGAMPGHHEFCWENLSTSDVAGALAFYEKVVGWAATPMPGTGGQTVIFSRPQGSEPAGIASVGQAPEGSRSAWSTTVSVASIGEATQKAKALGATVIVEPMDLPGTGSFSIIEDPTGAVIFLFESRGR